MVETVDGSCSGSVEVIVEVVEEVSHEVEEVSDRKSGSVSTAMSVKRVDSSESLDVSSPNGRSS